MNDFILFYFYFLKNQNYEKVDTWKYDIFKWNNRRTSDNSLKPLKIPTTILNARWSTS